MKSATGIREVICFLEGADVIASALEKALQKCGTRRDSLLKNVLSNLVKCVEVKMSSSKANWFQRYILFKLPIYKKRQCRNYHLVWERLCFCNVGEHWGGLGDYPSWHGGVRDLKTGKEYFPYAEPPKHEPYGLCFCDACVKKFRVECESKKAQARAMIDKERQNALSGLVRSTVKLSSSLSVVDELPQGAYAKYEASSIKLDPLPEGAYAFLHLDSCCSEVCSEEQKLNQKDFSKNS